MHKNPNPADEREPDFIRHSRELAREFGPGYAVALFHVSFRVKSAADARSVLNRLDDLVHAAFEEQRDLATITAVALDGELVDLSSEADAI